MKSRNDTFIAQLQKLAGLIGISGASQEKEMLALEELFTASQSDLDDLLAQMQEKTTQIEDHLRRLNDEYKTFTRSPTNRRIVALRIEREAKRLRRLEAQVNILFAKIETGDIALNKIEQWRIAEKEGATENQLDDIALSLETSAEKLDGTVRAGRDLDKTSYREAEMREPDVDVVADAEERAVADAEGSSVADHLSDETKKMLKELE